MKMHWMGGAGLALAALVAVAGTQGALAAAASGYKVVDRIAGPDGGWDYAAVDAKNNRVLVARGNNIMSVDLATKAVNGTFATGEGTHAALPINDGAQVLITNGRANTATIVDGKTGALVATIPTAKGPDAATFDPATGLVLVMGHASGDVTLIDPKAKKAVGTITIGGDLEAAAVDGAGKAYVNVENKGEVVAIDIKAGKVLARYKPEGCEGPTGIAYDKAGDRLFITGKDWPHLYEIRLDAEPVR